MSKKILFSPIGGTDPIKNFRDGSMLHICRHYLPDIIYLYLSHEMMVYHRKDNRYIDSIDRLGTHLGHHFEVRSIERDGLIDVQQYDIFYQDFREEIRKIENDMEKDDELLINMASGTPAMKSALLVMATLAEYRFHPIQVSTPQKSRNKEPDDRDDYDIAANWELNEDNGENAPNRCTEVKCLNLMKMLKIETIKKHIGAYDYSAALSVAEELKEDLDDDAYLMLQIADARIKLNLRKICTLANKSEKKIDIYPIKEDDKKEIFEYALGLQIKIRKQELAEFIRGITPLVADLLENILKIKCGIRLEDCCIKNRKDIWEWSRKRLQQMGLLEMLDKEYGEFRPGPVYSHHIHKIICYKCSDQVLCQKISDIINVESNVRNMAAHDIISVTDQLIKKQTHKTAQQIMDTLRYLIGQAGIHVREEYWRSYDKMNEEIEMLLR